jgi:hypothetical protein
MTSDAFIAWAMEQPKGRRYELLAGRVVAMAPDHHPDPDRSRGRAATRSARIDGDGPFRNMNTMRHSPRKRPALTKPRHPRDADIPPVPTFPTDANPATPPPSATDEDEARERVRQMVEAAYT